MTRDVSSSPTHSRAAGAARGAVAGHASRAARIAAAGRVAGAITLACSAVLAAASPTAVPACRAESRAVVTPVIELYTSEGCNSCPAADRWLARFKGRDDVVALAFHVDYWDRLGWVDRFASPAFTRRQVEQQAINGARFAYTPQVVVQGRDRKDWPGWRAAASMPRAPVHIAITREGGQIVATVRALADAPASLAAYWALTESGHRSEVKAGENRGVTLEHEFVVRELQAVPPWHAARGSTQHLRFMPPHDADPAHPSQIQLVVTDASSGRPVQAVSLGC